MMEASKAGTAVRPKILMIAGEASGDSRGAELIRAIRKKVPESVFFGIGGDRMAGAGMEIRRHVRETAFLGFLEVIRHLPFIRRVFREMTRFLDERNPDLVILVDYPGFNLRFAGIAKKRGFRVVYYISPQIWAWGGGRIRKIRKTVDHMIVVFPFEESFYGRAGVPVTFVGHPLTDTFHVEETRESFFASLDLDAGGKTLGLLPGSRKQEVRRLLPEMVGAARILKTRIPGLQCVVGQSPTLSDEDYAPFLSGTDIRGVRGRTHALMRHCDALAVASGTATLEAAVAGTPMVVVYKMAPLSYRIGKRLVRVEHIGLVNIVAGRRLVPELIQSGARSERIAGTLWPLLVEEDPIRFMREGLRETVSRLGEPGAADRAADVVVRFLGGADKG